MKNISLFLLASLSLWAAATTAPAQSNFEPYSFTRFAGNGAGSSDGDNISGAAQFNDPHGIAVDAADNIYVADTANNTIRKVRASGFITTFAGLAGSPGSANGTGNAARFNGPRGVAVDGAGNVYVADSANHLIRKIDPTGVVSTLAGLAGSSGSTDGTEAAARFFSPGSLAVDGAGNVYVADTDNSTIRKITPSGAVTTLAGTPGATGSADGTGSAATFFKPSGIALDSAANVFVADTENNTIRKITPSGAVTTLAGLAGSPGSTDGTGTASRFSKPVGLKVDGSNNIFVTDSANNRVRKITASAVVTTIENPAGFFNPQGITADNVGNVFVSGDNQIQVGVSPQSNYLPYSFTTFVGPGLAEPFSNPRGMAIDGSGNIYVADASNSTIRKISSSGSVSTLAGLALTPGSTDGTGSAARFNGPIGVAVDGAGNVYVADFGNSTIRKITPSGTVTTLAGLAGAAGCTNGTGTNARFIQPSDVAVDSAGNVYVAEYSSTIRKVTPAGEVTTVAGICGTPGNDDGTGGGARFDAPAGIDVDSAGNLYVSNLGGQTVRKITPSGVVITIAGIPRSLGSVDGTGRGARFADAFALAVDGASNIYVADSGKNTIRRISPSGVVRTIGGLAGTAGNTNGSGSAARFFAPQGIAVDAAGNVYVADSANNTIRIGVAGPLPAITSPLTASTFIGQRFVYQFEATDATSLAVSNLPPGLTFNSSLSAIVGTPTSQGTFQIALSASNASGTTNATLSLTVQPAPSGPVIVSSTAATGRTGQPFSFQVITTGGSSSTRLSASGLPPGLTVDSVTGLISGIPAADGGSAVTLTVTDGVLMNQSILQLTFTSDLAVPVIISPSSAALTPAQSFSYTISAPANSDPSDVTTFTLIGALPAGLDFDPTTGTISGTFTGQFRHDGGPPKRPDLSGGIVGNVQIFATNSHGTSTVPLNFFIAPSGPVNISTRIPVGTGNNVLIGGFIITGNAPKKVLIRAIGPSLNPNVPGALQDTALELYEQGSSTPLGTNNDWRGSQENEIIATGIPPTDDRESAILATLIPGSYTAVLRGQNDSTGIAVVEVYDLETVGLDASSQAQLAQISTRGTVLSDDNVMIGGFIISGRATKVLVRAIGPELNDFVPGALQDTTLELRDGSGSLIFENDDWRSNQEQAIIDTTVPPKDDRESAVVATLNPGPYTAIVRGKDNTTGVALVEVYGLQ